MVGIAKKKENSVATVRDAPRSIAPIIVAPEREVPGIMERHWINPIKNAVLNPKFFIDDIFGTNGFLSTAKIIKPPIRSVIATIQGLNNVFSMRPANKAPKIIAGSMPMIVLYQMLNVSLFLSRSFVNGQSFFLKYTKTARIAPSCITISNSKVNSLLNDINWFARIRCPVEEIGKNSVNPSTSPNIIALSVSKIINVIYPIYQKSALIKSRFLSFFHKLKTRGVPLVFNLYSSMVLLKTRILQRRFLECLRA